MKKKSMLLISVLLIIVLCSFSTGFSWFSENSTGIKNEEELLTDLVANSSFYMQEGCTATELSVIKRWTDEDARTDKVYVAINIDHEIATETRAYIMYYTRYNEGWLLDSIETYYGDEIEWTVRPKKGPTNEQIMECLISYSNSYIDIAYSEQYVSDELPRTYFFEEGKYSTEIYSGNMLSDSVYSCVVMTNRNFEYMKVNEEQLLYFMFDNNRYEWYIYDDEIMDVYATSYIDGTWLVPTSGATIQYTCIEQAGLNIYGYSNPYVKYHALCTINNETLEYTCTLNIPTSKCIDISWNNIGDVIRGPVGLDIEVTPDMIWCFDWLYRRHFKLEPLFLDHTPEPFEIETAIVDMSTAKNAEPYSELAKNVINALWIHSDFAYVENILHPVFEEYSSDEIFEEITLLKDRIGEYTIRSVTHIDTQVIEKNESDEYFEDYFLVLEDEGYNVEEIIYSTFYLHFQDSEKVGFTYDIYFAKAGEEIYLIIFE